MNVASLLERVLCALGWVPRCALDPETGVKGVLWEQLSLGGIVKCRWQNGKTWAAVEADFVASLLSCDCSVTNTQFCEKDPETEVTVSEGIVRWTECPGQPRLVEWFDLTGGSIPAPDGDLFGADCTTPLADPPLPAPCGDVIKIERLQVEVSGAILDNNWTVSPTGAYPLIKFNRTMTAETTLVNGLTFQWEQVPRPGWTAQINAWANNPADAASFKAAYEAFLAANWKAGICTVQPACGLNGCGGLPGMHPALAAAGLSPYARHIGIVCCDPEWLPATTEVISVSGTFGKQVVAGDIHNNEPTALDAPVKFNRIVSCLDGVIITTYTEPDCVTPIDVRTLPPEVCWEPCVEETVDELACAVVPCEEATPGVPARCGWGLDLGEPSYPLTLDEGGFIWTFCGAVTTWPAGTVIADQAELLAMLNAIDGVIAQAAGNVLQFLLDCDCEAPTLMVGDDPAIAWVRDNTLDTEATDPVEGGEGCALRTVGKNDDRRDDLLEQMLSEGGATVESCGWKCVGRVGQRALGHPDSLFAAGPVATPVPWADFVIDLSADGFTVTDSPIFNNIGQIVQDVREVCITGPAPTPTLSISGGPFTSDAALVCTERFAQLTKTCGASLDDVVAKLCEVFPPCVDTEDCEVADSGSYNTRIQSGFSVFDNGTNGPGTGIKLANVPALVAAAWQTAITNGHEIRIELPTGEVFNASNITGSPVAGTISIVGEAPTCLAVGVNGDGTTGGVTWAVLIP